MTGRGVIAATTATGLAVGLSVAGMAPGLAARPAPAPVLAAAPMVAGTTDYRSVVATLKAEIPAMMRRLGVVGATVALVDGDRVVMARGFGWADQARRRPVTARTLFHIGSLSKTLTAASVMQLVEQGRVDLDAPLTRYVPQLRLLPRYRRNTITVRSVLDHHSGVPGDVFHGMITLGRPDRGFSAWLLEALRRMPPERRVNTGFAYNNSGFVLLRLLVESVTGQPFAARTQRTLFRRIGMRSSTFDDTLPPGRALTRNYAPALDARGQPVTRPRVGPREYVNGWTAGSVVSSAKDMAKYLRTLVNRGRGDRGRILRARTLRRMTRPQTDLPVDMGLRMGLSWFVADGWMGRTFGHDGATTRNFSMLTIHPAQQLGVFVSTNTAGGNALADAVAERAMTLAYTAKTGIPEPPPVELPQLRARQPSARELARAAGTYAGYTDSVRVRLDGSRLVMTTKSGAPPSVQTLTALRTGWWGVVDNPGEQVAFRTIGGRRFLLARYGGGSDLRPTILGERVRTTRLPRAWRRATGAYRARLDAAHATDLVPRTVRLVSDDSVLVMRLGPAPALGRQVLHPVGAHRAFTFGWSGNGGRRKGDLVTLDGNRISSMGVVYRRVR